MEFVFTKEAEKDFLKLEKAVQMLIGKKLQKIKD
jgi:mRNA-degrading endonuclease RelE of RelBE toxin-antitoxin system